METFITMIDYLRQLNMTSTIVRMTFAVLFGGLIGLEREHKHRPAGFRTYMLVCLGAAVTMMLSQYESLMVATRWAETAAEVGIKTDVSRFGAQVINGIGFLGAGTIIVTGRQEVKGTTTAAGLWASACMGLAIGAGFYECMILGFFLIFLCFKVFPIIEDTMVEKARNMNLYTEFESIDNVGVIINQIKSMDIQIYDIEIDRGMDSRKRYPSAVFAIRLPQKQHHTEVLTKLSELRDIHVIEEI